MTHFEQLQSHRGGLIRLKTELYWYYGRGWDNNPGRICLLLDVATAAALELAVDRAAPAARTTAASAPFAAFAAEADPGALLLIDGQPQWVWLAEQDVEVINESR